MTTTPNTTPSTTPRLPWRAARVVAVRSETATARTVVFHVPGWPGHLPGQHVDIRLTAEDGYSTQRSYSLASAAHGETIELTVQRVPDGEVPPFLVDELTIEDELEIRGPIGGWFVWRTADPEPVLLVGGGSGIVPLMAMVRDRGQAQSRVPFRLIYSVRSPAEVYYADELRRRIRDDRGFDVSVIYTRHGTEHETRAPGRIAQHDVEAGGWPAQLMPRSYICGPTGFVETAASLLVMHGHDPTTIRTERFGPTGA